MKEFHRATQKTARARGEERRADGKVTYESCGERSKHRERKEGEYR